MPDVPCPLTVVVLSVGAPADLPGAVASLTSQEPRPVVVVVNSGGGDARGRLSDVSVDAVVDSPERLSHGAARNAGLAAARSPYVAFLSADCRARPGWVAERLRRHRAGEHAVASAVTNRFPDSVAARASHVVLFSRRMPGTPPAQVLRYGVSYDRRVFDLVGRFDESLPGGEDTEFHARLTRSGVDISWAPLVQTEHPHPQTVRTMMREQRSRGSRSAAVWRDLQGPSPRYVAVNAVRRAVADVARAWRATDQQGRRQMAPALALVPLAVVAYASGAAAIGRST